MKIKFPKYFTIANLCAILFSTTAFAIPQIGQPAPDFTATDTYGKTVHLADFKGKEVILEWSNDECPYVHKWYSSGEMQKLQKDATDKGAVWLTVISSAKGKEGNVSNVQANSDTKTRNAAPTFVILDPSGIIGHAYNALTTPDIFVINKEGNLAYMGGADSIASTKIADLQKAEPYAREAIDAVANDQPVKNPITRPYGCNVKY
jgi:peroxiredoxin